MKKFSLAIVALVICAAYASAMPPQAPPVAQSCPCGPSCDCPAGVCPACPSPVSSASNAPSFSNNDCPGGVCRRVESVSQPMNVSRPVTTWAQQPMSIAALFQTPAPSYSAPVRVYSQPVQRVTYQPVQTTKARATYSNCCGVSNYRPVSYYSNDAPRHVANYRATPIRRVFTGGNCASGQCGVSRRR